MSTKNLGWMITFLLVSISLGLAAGPVYSQPSAPMPMLTPTFPVSLTPTPETEPVASPLFLSSSNEEAELHIPEQVLEGRALVEANQALPYLYFLFSIGAQAPVGQFNFPCGVAVAPDGTIYVVDRWNNRIQHFSVTTYPPASRETG